MEKVNNNTSSAGGSGRRSLKNIDVVSGQMYEPSYFGQLCFICFNLLNEPCNVCEDQGVKETGCNTTLGKCSHIFHKDCIERMLLNGPYCPIDGELWVSDD